MKMPVAAIAAATLFAAAPRVSVAQEPTLAVEESGQLRHFALSLDEIGRRGPDGHDEWEKGSPTTRDKMLARSARTTAAGPGRLVYYEEGQPRSERTRRMLTQEVLVRLGPGASAAKVAAAAGATSWSQPPFLPDGALLTFAGGSPEAVAGAARLKTVAGVKAVEPQLARRLFPRFVPNDPYFAYSASNAGYQWHLRNTGNNGGVAGIDVNVVPAWDAVQGSGIRIGIIDDGLQVAHPDLSPNVDTVNGYDWNGGDSDPSPGAGDNHGTACAGVAAARGNNALGVSGAAPQATLVGLRLTSALASDSEEAAAFSRRNDIIQVKSNSWGPYDDGNIVEGPGALAAAALADAATNGRGGLGTIFVWAGGNGLASGDDSNFDGYANSIYTIAVGATGDQGTQAWYSESGANLLISAPSNGNGQGITTVDLTGTSGYNAGSSSSNYGDNNYTNDFGGTSSACPLVAGCVALLLESRPELGWRDVKEILLRSAKKQSPADSGWFNNGAGYHFNDKFGAGLVDAKAAIDLAAAWAPLGPMASHSYVHTALAAAIPDGSGTGTVQTFTVPAGDNVRTEEVTMSVDISHTIRGQLEILLTSPAGTTSRLIRPRSADTGSNLVWKMSTPQFWGENSAGLWSLRVRDTVSGATGTLNAATLAVYGATETLTPDPLLADAIEATTTVYTAGHGLWTSQSAVTHDGIDAARSGIIGHSQNSRLETTVTGPGKLTFWWKVSAAAGDRLACLIDGAEVSSITGEVDWAQFQRTLSTGIHSVVLRYEKDAAGVSGSDAAWVDGLSIGPITDLPVITSPATVTATTGVAFNYQITATNEPTSFNANGLPPGLTLAPATGLISGTPTTAGSFTAAVSATNAAGTGAQFVTITVGDASAGVADAVDTPGRTFTFTGQAWRSQTSVTHDGVDAAASGAISNQSSSVFSTTVTGPMAVNFWWKVSSEQGYDFLNLLVDGVVKRSISGEVDWTAVTESLPSGTHTVSWSYEKDFSAVEGADTGYVDQLEIAPLTQPPAVTGGTTFGAISTAFSYQIQATNGPDSYGATNLPPGLTVNSTTGLITGTPTAVGTYAATLSATNAIGTGSSTLTITVQTYSQLIGSAVESPLTFASTVAAPWRHDAEVSHDGVDSVRSGAIGDSSQSSLTTTVVGPTTLSFWWKVSSEPNYDYLRLLIDNVQVAQISGETDWALLSQAVASGSHSVEWRYLKDSSDSQGVDAGWIDNVTAPAPVFSAVQLTAAGLSTGFQEPALGALSYIRGSAGSAELGWVANAGKVAEAGNRTPALTGATVTGTSGVKSFLINNNGTVTLRTDNVRLDGFVNATAEADIRAYTTSSTGFEAADNLRVYPEWSVDGSVWTAGTDIVPLKTGGTPDSLIALTSTGNAVYSHFSVAIPITVRYARIVVAGSTDAASEFLVIDNLRFGGTPAPDADGDGYTLYDEAWFGTSDSNPAASPALLVVPQGNGTSSVTLPSVAGRSYAISASSNLSDWETTVVQATGTSTTWVDANAQNAPRRYFRAGRP